MSAAMKALTYYGENDIRFLRATSTSHYRSN